VSFVYVGSKNRIPMPIARWLPLSNVTLFVERTEEARYRAEYPGVARLVVLEHNDRGFAYLLNAMARYARSVGESHYLFADDDITGLVVRPTMAHKFVRVRGEDATRVLRQTLDAGSRLGYAQLAVSFAGHSWRAAKASESQVGAWGMLVVDVEAMLSAGGADESLYTFNDWDLSARLILAGKRTARTNLVSFQHKMKSVPGGAEQFYRRQDLVEGAARTLAERYEGVRVVKIPGHEMIEPRFNWKKLALRRELVGGRP
jgi:hypothetical protein